jgi:hypothetical protein
MGVKREPIMLLRVTKRSIKIRNEMSCARDLDALPSRLRHSAERCHYVEAPCSLARVRTRPGALAEMSSPGAGASDGRAGTGTGRAGSRGHRGNPRTVATPTDDSEHGAVAAPLA